MRHGIEQSPEDARSRDLKLAPKLGLWSPLGVTDRRKRQEDSAICEIGPADYILNAVEQDRARGLEQHLLVIGVELAHREAATAGEATKRIGDPSRQAR